ncbi:uncharacterized protein [Nicotiana sylvestris]|uniref:uncharacterized protein n=1 Tax=Nicotiana sylvestris TaxID=4096 RepID=UPI00388C7ECC
MRDHVIEEDYELWDIVNDGPLATLKKNAEGVNVPKTRADCTTEDLRKWEKNAKAKKLLVCGLGPDEYNRIQGCTTAKQISDTLEVAHERTPQVKRSRGTLLYSQYESFVMKEGETIQELYIRITAIRESKNIATLPVDELIGNLIAYELGRQNINIDVPKKERSLSLRITKGSNLEDDEMTMITKDFKKYLSCSLWEIEWNKKRVERRNMKKEQVQPKKSNNKGSTKAMVSAWGDSSDECSDDNNDNERALMAIGESDKEAEVSVSHLKDKIKFLPKERFSELLLELIDESEDVNNEKEQLSKGCVVLKAKCKNLEHMASETESENVVLKNHVHELDTTILELISENLKLKLGTSKKTVDHTQLTLEENVGKMKDYLYKRDEQIKILKEDLRKVKHELDRTYKWNRSSDALSWLQEHHSSNKRGLGFGNPAPKWDPKSKYLTLSENKICTHCGKTDHYKVNALQKKSLISVSQLRDRGNMVAFTSIKCFVINLITNKIVLQGKKVNNIYIVDLSTLSDNELTCLSVLDNDPILWHKRFGHASLSQLNKLVSKDLVIGLPNIKFKEDKVCDACAREKQIRSSFKSKKMISTTRMMELVHIDLCGPIKTLSRGGKRYVMVLVDDYSRFTWTLFLRFKDEAFDIFTSFVRKNSETTRTPQQNGVVERMNSTLEEVARTMLLSSKLAHSLWAEAVNTACYIINR